jgi:hypothetical protein
MLTLHAKLTSQGKMVKVAQKHDSILVEAAQDKGHKDTAIQFLRDNIGAWQNSKLLAIELVTYKPPNIYLPTIICTTELLHYLCKL